ncbi:MAG TPA: V-type ATP synthase subunit F [Candidatus Wunengus sp. YC64]|uniref:V-type ATP synthase subunit F n=1 Tax=Candidatus Wunengus sp. YC64 TaxID=3367700 RepID=UPI00402561CA
MSKIVIIGEKKDILSYQSIGVEIKPVKTTAETVSVLREITQNTQVAIILITENMAEQCLDTITELRNKTNKAITIVPTEQGSRRTSIIELNKEIARAVGMDILTKTE